ncbi:la-related 7 isoform X7, partial [Paramuricea clavata]
MEENDNNGSEVKAEEGAENTEKVEKKHKKRQKKTLADLQKQIEFYFSEPNLQKDRFLRQRIAESDNGCVEIETIASFNRMKQLCGDISLIVKAMKLCPTVEVIDDKWVKPSQSLPEPKNVDSVTVYVERLPSHADHNWIKSLFSACGNVVYVSLPRYKTTREIKGFAFVEFEKESEAEAALKMFAEKPSKEGDETENKTGNDEEHTGKHNKKNKKRKAKLSESENEDTKGKSKKSKRKRDDAASTSSIPDTDVPKKTRRTVEKEICEERGQKKAKRENEKDNEQSGGDDTSEETKSEKRKRKRSEANDDGGTSSKKNKESQESDDEGCTSCKKSEEAGAEGGGVEESEMDDDDDKKKKKRKRKKKEKQEVEVPQLRVISKTEWLSLKKEYQKLQRQAMKDAKQKLKIEFEDKTEQASKTNEKSQEDEEVKTEEDKTEEDKTERVKDNEKTASKNEKELPQKLEMEPGVVLKFSSDENIDKRQLR